MLLPKNKEVALCACVLLKLKSIHSMAPLHVINCRCASTRLFNNVAVPIVSEEEAIESLRAICESFKVALSVKSLSVPLFEGKLERRRSKMAALLFQHAAVETRASASSAASGSKGIPPQLDMPLLPPAGSLPRNISEGQLMNFVGQ
ncbi:putative suppressor of actin-like, partial [Tropilaelaps mercedesae]